MIFILLRKLTDSSEDVFTNIKFQTLFCHSSAVVSFYSYILKKKKFHRWIKLLTFEPLSLKIISTSKILPNCCKEREKVTWKLDNFNSSIIYNTKVCFRKCCKALRTLNDINPNILNTKRKTLKGVRSILFLNCVHHSAHYNHSTEELEAQWSPCQRGESIKLRAQWSQSPKFLHFPEEVKQFGYFCITGIRLNQMGVLLLASWTEDFFPPLLKWVTMVPLRSFVLLEHNLEN